MENVIHKLTLDLTGPDMLPRIEVQQDNARSLSISLTQGGRPYWIAEGVTAVFSGRKPDGKPLFNACAIEKNRVRYDFTDQTTNVAGIVECEILLYSGDERILASPRFELAVDELIHKDTDVPESAPELNALTQMVSAGTALMEDLQEALSGLEGVEEFLVQARAAAQVARDASHSAGESAVQAQTAAQSAARSEEATGRAAGTAQSASSQAQASAQRAFSSAEGAAESLEKAIAAGKLTRQLQQQAEAARDSAGESAAQASGYAETASASAEQAGAALQQIGMVVGSSIESHNVGRYAHDDIRRELRALADRVYAVLNSDDATLDQLSEIVAYIKSNKTLIDAITTSKVSVSDIVNNLTTNVANKPLSAAQGVVLARRIETVRQITDEIERGLTDKLAADELPEAIENALAQAKESGEFDGAAGPQGPQGAPGPAGADGPPGADYVLTDADRQEIAEIAAGLVEVPGGGGTEATKWSEEKIFTLEEDAAIVDIDLGGEYDEVIFVVVYYKASSATASAHACIGVGLEDGKIVDIVAGKTESGDGLKWDFHRLHCCKQGNGRMLTATTQSSITPNSVYYGNGVYPYRDYRIVLSGSSAKITSIIMRTWTDGALFGAGTKVFYIMR